MPTAFNTKPRDQTPEFDPADRRQAQRRPVSHKIAGVTMEGGQSWEGRLRDASTLGLGFVAATRLEEGALVELDLTGASRGTLGRVLARVVHVDLEGPGLWIVGCAFAAELSDTELGLFQAERVRTTTGDSRRWVRFPCNVETLCFTSETAPGERRPARIVNVSAGGIGLMLPCDFPQGTLLRFEMPSDLGQPGGDMLVRVMRVLEHGRGAWFLGCEFVQQLSEEELQNLVRDRRRPGCSATNN